MGRAYRYKVASSDWLVLWPVDGMPLHDFLDVILRRSA